MECRYRGALIGRLVTGPDGFLAYRKAGPRQRKEDALNRQMSAMVNNIMRESSGERSKVDPLSALSAQQAWANKPCLSELSQFGAGNYCGCGPCSRNRALVSNNYRGHNWINQDRTGYGW